MIDTVIKADGAPVMRNHDPLPVGEPAINSPFLIGKQMAGLALMLALCHAVPKAIIDDQQDIRIEDALTKNVSGVQRAYAFGDFYPARITGLAHFW
jgi:hypothetical protein